MEKEAIVYASLGKRQSLPEELATIIMRRIESGEFRTGDVLPSEQQLSESFAVSRTVVREALARLKYEGVIESKRGSGPVVKSIFTARGFMVDVDALSQSEYAHFFECRIMMEGDAAALTALRRTEQDLTVLMGHLEDLRIAIAGKDSGNEPDYLFHQCIADFTGNPYFGNFVKFLSAKIWLGVQRARWRSNQDPALAAAVFEEHREIFQAISDGDPHKARAMAQRHLLNSARRQGITPDERFLAPPA